MLFGDTAVYLRDNLKKSKPGDFIVTAQNKTYTLLHIYDKSDQTITIEEVSAPAGKIPKGMSSWKSWIKQNAPGHTSWVIYTIDLTTGKMKENYSFTKNAWYAVSDADNYLSTLLNLRLVKIPLKDRKKVGPQPDSGPDWRVVWQPRMVVEGKEIPGVEFEGWRTRWPKDSTDLSGRTIEVYVPVENDKYPAYFPYWLQISGVIGKAKIRIIDSGQDLSSPRHIPSTR